MLLPYLSESDPNVVSEGSLDPLGLYPISDRLATKMVPGFRERMQHPRFLTAIAVGTAVCSEFDEDIVASDGFTPPYQVYEWYIIQGLTRVYGVSDENRGLNGREKASRAIKDGVPLSAVRYLKVPNVFGFHGVYRTLARDTNLLIGDQLGEFGDTLVRTWEKEQKLNGFYSTNNGPGKDFRLKLFDAVKDGLDKGAVARTMNWPFFWEMAPHFAIYQIGRKESQTIYNYILNDERSTRNEVIRFLLSDEGQNIWLKTFSEKEFHQAFYPHASERLKALLKVIQKYERFSRMLQNVFDCSLYQMSRSSRLALSELAKSSEVEIASKELPDLTHEIIDLIEAFGEALTFQNTFGEFASKSTPLKWLETFIAHHMIIQKNKPPNGKRPWFEKTEYGELLIYPSYITDEKPNGKDEYVNYYRTDPLWSFMKDLKRTRNGPNE